MSEQLVKLMNELDKVSVKELWNCAVEQLRREMNDELKGMVWGETRVVRDGVVKVFLETKYNEDEEKMKSSYSYILRGVTGDLESKEYSKKKDMVDALAEQYVKVYFS